MTTERRGTARTPVLTPAQIRVQGERPFFCLVHDWSPNGAALSVDDGVVLPEQFGLRLFTDGEVRRVRLVWRIGERLGVAFEAATAEHVAPA